MDQESNNQGKQGGTTWAVAGLVCALLALLFPLVMGIAGIALGVVSHRKGGAGLATATIVVAALCLIVGLIRMSLNPYA